ncbi:MAG: MATE family efflux transporter [Eubacteriales bacterium]|nr:MATE family efflux transporter [Eubacteriales bacterium]
MEKKLVSITFFKFFTAALAASVTLSFLSMTDLIIAGHAVGEVGLSAVSLALPLMMLVQILSALFGMGGAIVYSEKLGSGDLEGCARVFRTAVFCALVFSLCVSFSGLFFEAALVRILGAGTAAEIREATAYIRTLLLGYPFLVLSPILVTFLRNDSQVFYSMLCVLFCASLNVVLSLFLCVGLSFGIGGIGAATVFSQMISCLLSIRVLGKNELLRSCKRRSGPFSAAVLKELLTPGSAVALIFFCQMLLTLCVNRILAPVSGAAVYAVVKYLINFLFALFDGVTAAMQPMLGIYYGERELKNIRYTARNSAFWIFLLAGIMFFLMEGFAAPLCMLFGVQSASLLVLSETAVRLIGISCLGSAAVTFLNAFYRSTGRAGISVRLSLCDNLVFPLLAICFYTYALKLGVTGVFLGLMTAPFLTLILWALSCRPKKRGILLLDPSDYPEEESAFHCIVPAEPEVIRNLMEEMEVFGKVQDIPMKTQYYMSLCVEELLLNVLGVSRAQSGKRNGRERKEYADIRILKKPDGTVLLRIRDTLTEWSGEWKRRQKLSEIPSAGEETGVNELGLGIVQAVAENYSLKRTIGFNNFSVTLKGGSR